MDVISRIDLQNTFVWVVVISLLLFLVKKIVRQVRITKMVYKFDGRKDNSFLIGNHELLNFNIDLHEYLRDNAKKYYPHYRIRMMHALTINILLPEDCEIIIGTKKHSTKSQMYQMLKNWLKDGLLLSSGEKWSRRRKILTPAFHFSILKEFIDIFNEQTSKLVENISERCSEKINVCPLVSEFALYTINETAMGHNLDPNNEEQKEYRDSIYETEKILRHKALRPWMYLSFIYIFFPYYKKEMRLLKILHNFTRKIISERMNNFKGMPELENKDDVEDDIYIKKKKRFAMLDVLLQAHQDGRQIDYEGICEEVDTFMFEGHDTTSTAVGFTLMLIANHPEIQEKIYQEIKSVLGTRTKPNYNDLQKMDLLERSIKESLRLYPSVHFMSRICDEDTVLHSGLVVPKDILVNIHIYDIHRNAEIYPNPDKFDPDRFLPENCINRHPFAYIPFSAGPRNCIGQKFAMLEIKALVTGILQHFVMTAIDTPETVKLRLEVILRTEDGIKIKFNPRT